MTIYEITREYIIDDECSFCGGELEIHIVESPDLEFTRCTKCYRIMALGTMRDKKVKIHQED